MQKALENIKNNVDGELFKKLKLDIYNKLPKILKGSSISYALNAFE
jgi:hypothetical protein